LKLLNEGTVAEAEGLAEITLKLAQSNLDIESIHKEEKWSWKTPAS